MNPYPERIEELHEFLAARYGQRDREATEILLACLLDSTIAGVRKPWLILETDFMSRETEPGWFSFGGTAATRSIASVRIERPARAQELITEWFDERSNNPNRDGIFVEAEYRSGAPPRRTRRYYSAEPFATYRAAVRDQYTLLLATTLRLRVAYPKGGIALRGTDCNDHAELGKLARRALDNSFRNRITHPLPVPDGFLYWCEVMQKLAPQMNDWDALTGQIAAVGRNVPLLYNDGRPFDKRSAERIIRDVIPHATREIMEETIRGAGKGLTDMTIMTKSARASRTEPEMWMRREMSRLIQLRAIDTRPLLRGKSTQFLYHPWRYEIAAEEYRRLIDRTGELL